MRLMFNCDSIMFLYFVGLITTQVPLNAVLARPASPHSLSVSQAFQQGLIFPTTLAVRKPSGQFIPFEDALASGLLYPRASSTMRREGSVAREGSIAREPVHNSMRAASLPPGGGQNYSYSYRKQQMSSRHGAAPMQHHTDRSATMNGHMGHGTMNSGMRVTPEALHTTNNLPHQSTGTLPHHTRNTGQQQQRLWEKSVHHQSTNNNQYGGEQSPGFYPADYPAQSNSPLLNGNAHFVNGKLFASRPGYKIEGNGNVVNMNNGETLTLGQAQKMHIIQQIPDDEYDAGTIPPNFSMFNRVSDGL